MVKINVEDKLLDTARKKFVDLAGLNDTALAEVLIRRALGETS